LLSGRSVFPIVWAKTDRLMPHIRPNRTAGGRAEVAFRGGSQVGAEHPALSKRARRAKRKLLGEAKALIGSTDSTRAAQQLSILKRRWDALGSAGSGDEQRLRKRFEAACAEVARNCARHRSEQAR
jgi:hypothetical protein